MKLTPMAAPTAVAALTLAALFATPAAALEEVPFITTPDHVTVAMLELARVGPADHVIDLGSGDGRIVITAARRFGASGLGVEIVPELVERSRAHAQAAGVAARTTFRAQDLFQTDLSAASVVTMYLLPDVNLQLRPALLALKPGTRIVSHDWDLGDWAPDRTLTVDVPDKAIGREKLSRLHLWVVPARLQGLWCSAGSTGGASLHINQQFQQAQARAETAPDTRTLGGRIDGAVLQLLAAEGTLTARAEDGRLQVVASTGAFAAWHGRSFAPAAGDRCPT